MIRFSTNVPAKKTPKTSTNSFALKSTNKSVNVFSKKGVKTALTVWQGTNLTDGGLGDDLYSPSPWGVDEAGSFSHFKNRDDVNISH